MGGVAVGDAHGGKQLLDEGKDVAHGLGADAGAGVVRLKQLDLATGLDKADKGGNGVAHWERPAPGQGKVLVDEAEASGPASRVQNRHVVRDEGDVWRRRAEEVRQQDVSFCVAVLRLARERGLQVAELEA